MATAVVVVRNTEISSRLHVEDGMSLFSKKTQNPKILNILNVCKQRRSNKTQRDECRKRVRRTFTSADGKSRMVLPFGESKVQRGCRPSPTFEQHSVESKAQHCKDRGADARSQPEGGGPQVCLAHVSVEQQEGERQAESHLVGEGGGGGSKCVQMEEDVADTKQKQSEKR